MRANTFTSNKTNQLILFCCLLLVFSSCSPVYSIVLNNQSAIEKNIKVMVTDRKKLYNTDSVLISRLGKDRTIPLVKDSDNLSFSFLLQKGDDAIIQQGSGGPDMKEKIVIDNTDTIHLQQPDSRVTITKKSLSTSVVINIK